MPRSFEDLVRTLRGIGADDPEGWARSEVAEGIPQLSRYVFLRQAWNVGVVSERDETWIDAHLRLSERDPGDPLAGTGHSLRRLLALGADRRDLVDLVRGMQYETLFALCYQLADAECTAPVVPGAGWALMECDDDGRLGRLIDGLHEDALRMDPTGREMRPRPR